MMNNSFKLFLTVCLFLLCGMSLWAQDSAVVNEENFTQETDIAESEFPTIDEDDVAENETSAVNEESFDENEYSSSNAEDDFADTEEALFTEENPDETESDAGSESGKKGFRMKNRIFEISLVNMNINVSNSFLTTEMILNKTLFGTLFSIGKLIQNPRDLTGDKVTINLNDVVDNGFRMILDADIKPVSLNFNWRDKWGFGLDIGSISAVGNITLSKNILHFAEKEADKFGLGAAVFADVGIPVFFHVNEFKIKFRPSAYSTLVYAEPGVTYSFKKVTNEDENEGQRMEIDWNMDVYSAVSLKSIMDGTFSASDIKYNEILSNLGYDFALGVEYPLFPWLDVGTDIKNIPVPGAGSRLSHYMRMEDSVYIDTSYISVADLLSGEDIPEEAVHFPENFDPVYGEGPVKKLYRPFTWMFYAVYRPFDTQLLSLLPSMGFSINRMYPRIGAFEGGLSARLDLANMLALTLGINYNDRLWKNSIDLMFNFRALELDIGLSSQSPRFVKSWQGAGIGLTFALKMGW